MSFIQDSESSVNRNNCRWNKIPKTCIIIPSQCCQNPKYLSVLMQELKRLRNVIEDCKVATAAANVGRSSCVNNSRSYRCCSVGTPTATEPTGGTFSVPSAYRCCRQFHLAHSRAPGSLLDWRQGLQNTLDLIHAFYGTA